jgi:hypothetical protein
MHREQDEPGDSVLLDRDGRPAFSTSLGPDGTVAISVIDPDTEIGGSWATWAARSTRWACNRSRSPPTGTARAAVRPARQPRGWRRGGAPAG